MSETSAALRLDVHADALRPLARALLAEWLNNIDRVTAKLGDDQLAYTEEHAARLLDLEKYQLRDARLHGKISASHIGAKRVMYLRSDLIAFLMAKRTEALEQHGPEAEKRNRGLGKAIVQNVQRSKKARTKKGSAPELSKASSAGEADHTLTLAPDLGSSPESAPACGLTGAGVGSPS
jgi:hypothetical protein